MDRNSPSGSTLQHAGFLLPALKTGAVGGSFGLIYGGVSGILRSGHPVARSIATSVHWFALGTSFSCLRRSILKFQFEDKATANQRTYASAVAGGLSGGGLSFLFNRRFMPGFVAFSVLGCVGQLSYNAIDAWQAEQQGKPARSWLERVADSRWVPIKSLSDEKYKEMLQEKLLTVEADIALLDERIQALRDSDSNERGDGSKAS